MHHKWRGHHLWEFRFYVFKDSVGEAGSGMLSTADMTMAATLGVEFMKYDLTGQVARQVPQGNVAANSYNAGRSGQQHQERLQQQRDVKDAADFFVNLSAPLRAGERRAAVRGATSDKITALGLVRMCTTRGSATRSDLWPRAAPAAIKRACHSPRG
jgi:hypothetical protein